MYICFLYTSSAFIEIGVPKGSRTPGWFIWFRYIILNMAITIISAFINVIVVLNELLSSPSLIDKYDEAEIT